MRYLCLILDEESNAIKARQEPERRFLEKRLAEIG